MNFKIWNHDEEMFIDAFIDQSGRIVRFDPVDGVVEIVDGEIVRSTGLFDKNNTEIFEGDLVKYTRKKGRILSGSIKVIKHSSIIEGTSSFCGFGITCDTGLSKPLADIIEVIGNIYENL